MNLQICQTRTPLSLRALGLLLAGSASTVQWGGGRLFDASANFFFTKTAITRKRKVEKSILRWEMNGLSEGYKWAVDQNWQKSDFLAKNRNFGPKKRESLFSPNHVLATTEKSCSKKKVAFAQIIKGENVILGDFLG